MVAPVFSVVGLLGICWCGSFALVMASSSSSQLGGFGFGLGTPRFVVIKNSSGVYKHFSNGFEFRIRTPSMATGSSSSLSSSSSSSSSSSGFGFLDDGAVSPNSLTALASWESVFQTKFERNAVTIKNKLASQQVEKIPWPAGDWPLVKDGINRQWDDDQPSASAKFAMANDLDVAEFQRNLSDDSGLLQAADLDHGGPCEQDSDCPTKPVLYLCGRAKDWDNGLCIPRWYGICDGWTSASLVEEEPKCPVQVNKVTFNVLDIKALLSKVYAVADYGFVSAGSICPPDRKDQLDAYGRYVDPTRRDIDPHVFHILVANVLGKFRKSLVLDIDALVPLFNYALRSYEIQQAKMMQPNEAARKFFDISSYSVFNADAVQVQYVKLSVKYIHEGYTDGALVSNSKAIDAATEELIYEYVLELDKDNEIIGGEWVGDSKKQHPDVVWYPYTAAPNDTESVGITYGFVSDLLQQSLKQSC